jgi:retron-type reverse transcriptase
MQAHVNEGHRWVVDIDLAQLFDRVNHDILMVCTRNTDTSY